MENKIVELNRRLDLWKSRRKYFKEQAFIRAEDIKRDLDDEDHSYEEYGLEWLEDDKREFKYYLDMALQANRCVQKIQTRLKEALEAH